MQQMKQVKKGIRPELFMWLSLVVACVSYLGMRIDSYGHFQVGAYESVFSGWHALLYAGIICSLLLYGGSRFLNSFSGIRPLIPAGYEISMIGVIVLALSLPGDVIWHTLFGFELNTEAVVSPPHWGLIIGLTLFAAGPLIAAWKQKLRELTWRHAFPVALSAGFTLSCATAYTFYANPLSRAAYIALPRYFQILQDSDNYFAPQLGAASFIVGSALLVGLALPLASRWKLPLGFFTLIFTIVTFFMTVFFNEYRMIIPMVFAGFAVDLMARYLKINQGNVTHGLLFAFLVPLITWIGFFLALFLTQGTYLRIHGWSGLIFLGAMSGLMIGGLYYLRPAECAETVEKA
ncbi:MAG TPA: hypothetical protein VHL11_14390 [Phototrophicaceae bacterium]|jgi:hypothetical protein|nr:hypothetical protein [Phototrophicaceae bacterium]